MSGQLLHAIQSLYECKRIRVNKRCWHTWHKIKAILCGFKGKFCLLFEFHEEDVNEDLEITLNRAATLSYESAEVVL